MTDQMARTGEGPEEGRWRRKAEVRKKEKGDLAKGGTEG